MRKKQLAGAEAYARVRHPQHGLVLPGAFTASASDASTARLAELALESALKTSAHFSKLGVNLRLSVNIPVPALVKIPVGDIVKKHHPADEKWPGLIIDLPEDQIVSDLALAVELSKKLEPHNVRLAIDNFGRAYSSLAKVEELPFEELKLDRSFVADCGTDKVNAPLCKTVIDLAHSFGRYVVAVGIEKAADALALVSMGCDYGQGFLLGQPMPEERFVSLLRQRAATQGRSLDGAAQPQKQPA
ncbi:MAG: EAL domain-containing protein [Pseudolabrys sp.]